MIWTVGFFEVEAVSAGVPQLGKEIFDKVPGDLRAQYAAVLDRSNLQVPVTPVAGTNGPKPWETKLTADAPIGSPSLIVEGTVNGASPASLRIYIDGQPVDVAAGTQIRLGYGNGEWVTIASVVGTAGTGTVTLNLTGTTTVFHGGSTRVSNTRPGNPGPQPGFDSAAPANRHVVPYFLRLDP